MSYRHDVQAGTVGELLADLYEPPAWVSREHFDPMHRMKEIREAARKGLIELDESSGDPETMRFRLTPAGFAQAHRAACVPVPEEPR